MTNVETIHSIIEEQNKTFLDRKIEILGTWLALLAWEHVFYLGKPGLAKSMVLEDMIRRILGAELFSIQLRKETKGSEIFGPLSLSALKQDKLRYNIKGFFPVAHIAYFDEIWKGNSNALNSLLRGINERVFMNGDDRVDMPLISVFSASNELPQGKELAAIYDRFLLRYEVHDLEDDDLKTLLMVEPEIDVNTTLSLDGLYQAQDEAADVKISEDLIDEIILVRRKLTEAGMWISPRRWKKSLKVIRAHAYLDEKSEADEHDLEVLQHCVWDNLDERSVARKIVLEQINPANAIILEILDTAERLFRDFKSRVAAGERPEDFALDTAQSLREGKDRLKSMAKQTTDQYMKDRLTETYTTVNKYHRYVLENGLGVTKEEQES